MADEEINPADIAFTRRRLRNMKIERVKNEDLPAGAPMFFYCQLCGEEFARPESYLTPVSVCMYCVFEGR